MWGERTTLSPQKLSILLWRRGEKMLSALYFFKKNLASLYHQPSVFLTFEDEGVIQVEGGRANQHLKRPPKTLFGIAPLSLPLLQQVVLY